MTLIATNEEIRGQKLILQQYISRVVDGIRS